jgi:hypothetical protein
LSGEILGDGWSRTGWWAQRDEEGHGGAVPLRLVDRGQIAVVLTPGGVNPAPTIGGATRAG